MKRFFAPLIVCLLLFLLPAAGLAETTADVEAAQALLQDYSVVELLQMWNEIGTMLHDNGMYPYSELAKGDTGYEVIVLQTQLAALGYYKKEIVDNFGNGTYSALRAFEKENDLKVNGIASAKDQQLLYQKAAALDTEAAAPETEPLNSKTPEELLQQWQQIAVALRSNGSYPFQVLQKGNVGYEVTMLQTRLQELNYYQKTIVDTFGNGTYDAIRKFQSQNGLKVDGIATVETQQLLYSADAKPYEQRTTTTTNQSNNNSSQNTAPDATSGATK